MIYGYSMDDFEKDFPGFDWKNVPAYKHPRGKDCPCPKHEYIREQINVTKFISNNNKEIGPEQRQKAQVTLKFCPDHYKVYFDEVIPSMPFKYRLMTKIAFRIGAVVIQKIPYMQSDQCFYCKFGSGGFDKKTPIIR
ncbi:MAG TPA: hypothetical protein VE622_05015 [Nitrososphaeraceae archaeon]|jgi:hypothetical protein|nr:hypothetical protein [Nitrososphaeraceae archaeon]